MALTATWSFSRVDTTGKAQELIDRGDSGVDGDRHFYTVTGAKAEIDAYISDVTTDTYSPVDSVTESILFSTLYSSITDVCTLYKSRKPNKLGNFTYGLDESAFKRLDSQASRITNTLLQSKLIDAKFASVMGLKTSTAVAQTVSKMSLDEEEETEIETAQPKAKKKADVEADSE